MILIDGYKEFCGTNKEYAISSLDQLTFERNISAYIGKDKDGDFYLFTDNHINSEGISNEEADIIIKENDDKNTHFIKIEIIK